MRKERVFYKPLIRKLLQSGQPMTVGELFDAIPGSSGHSAIYNALRGMPDAYRSGWRSRAALWRVVAVPEDAPRAKK